MIPPIRFQKSFSAALAMLAVSVAWSQEVAGDAMSPATSFEIAEDAADSANSAETSEEAVADDAVPLSEVDESPEISETDTEPENPAVPGGPVQLPPDPLPVNPMSGDGESEAALLPAGIDNPETVPHWIPPSPEDDLLEIQMQPTPLDETESETTDIAEFPQVPDPWAVGLTDYSGYGQGKYGYLLGGAPTGFRGSTVAPGTRSTLSGLSVIAELGASYNSNITQATGDVGSPVIEDFLMSVGGTVSYLSKGREWTFGGSYTGMLDVYFDNSDFNGYNQSANLLASYNGAKLDATVTAEIARERGGNRFYGPSEFVEQTRASIGVSSAYELGPKTILTGDAVYSHTTASGGDFEDTDAFSSGIAALWKYSPITQFGPGLRLTYDSNSQNDRTSIGPTLNVNYKLSTKISMTSRVGLDFTDYSNAGSEDPSTSALLGLNWNASKLWGMDLSVYRDTEADPSISGAFNEITAIRVGYNRKIRRASLTLGAGYEMAETVGNSGPSRSDRDYFTLDASLEMMVFRNTTNASVFVRFSDQNGGGGESFDSTIAGVGLSRTF